MNVLLLNGSPHAQGCTYTSLAEVAGALESCGVETEIFQLGTEPIRGCVACGGCSAGKGCVLPEGRVNDFIGKMAKADGLVVGSPVYYASANGALISFLDRAFYAGGDCFAHKPAAAVASARRAGTTATLDELNKYFTIKQMPVVSSTYWNMVHGHSPEEVRQDREGLQTMRNLGRNMAWLLKCIALGRTQGIEPPAAESGNWTNFIR